MGFSEAWGEKLRKGLYDLRCKQGILLLFTTYKVLAFLVFAEGVGLFGTVEASGVLIPWLVFLMGVCVFICIVYAAMNTRVSTLRVKDWYLAFSAACMFLGVLFLFFENYAGIASEGFRRACSVLGVVLLGCGITAIHVELGGLFGALGMMPTVVFGAASSFLAIFVVLALELFSFTLAKWLFLFFAALVVPLLFAFARKKTFSDWRGLYRQKHAGDFRIPYRFVATSAVQGAAIGVFLGYASSAGSLGLETSLLGYFFAVILVFVTALGMRLDFNRSIYHVGFVLLSVGLLGVGLEVFSNSFAEILMPAGFFYLDLVLWSLGSYLIKDRGQSAVWLVVWPMAALMVGCASGIVTGTWLFQGGWILAGGDAFFYVASFAVVLAALLLSSERNIQTGWGFVRPGGSLEGENSLMACQLVAGETGLTQRELEIMHLLVCGKTRKDIAREMVVSANTVKSHVYNLYRKVGVHSEEELRAKVMLRGKMLSTRGMNESSVANPLAEEGLATDEKTSSR